MTARLRILARVIVLAGALYYVEFLVTRELVEQIEDLTSPVGPGSARRVVPVDGSDASLADGHDRSNGTGPAVVRSEA